MPGTERKADEARHTLTLPSDVEMLVTRDFAAPRALVFDAFTRSEHVRRWWGWRDSEILVCEHDARPGGHWRVVSRGKDGVEHAFRGEYREVVRPERVVYTFEYEGMPGQICVESITFEERDGVTTLTNRTSFDTQAERDGMLDSMDGGMAESFTRIDELLAAIT